MDITYKRLRVLMAEYDLQWQDINSGAKVSWGTISKINKDEHINLSSLVKICEFMSAESGKFIDISDVVQIKK